MITANELRIGNWVMYDNRYFQIECNSVHFPYLRTAEFGAGVVDYNNIHGIPLTEEILLKCGFEKYKGDWCINDFKIFNTDYLGFYLIDERLIGQPFEYVHQLQNLFYALTKTELIINL